MIPSACAISPTKPIAAPAAPAAKPTALLARIDAIYNSDSWNKVPKEITTIKNPTKAPELRGTAALELYNNLEGEGPDLSRVTDGDHVIYRVKSGEFVVAAFPEDAAWDEVWVYAKDGNTELGHGAINSHGKLHLTVSPVGGHEWAGQLALALKAGKPFAMPPTAKKYNANEITTTVDVVPVNDSHAKVFEKAKRDAIKRFETMIGSPYKKDGSGWEDIPANEKAKATDAFVHSYLLEVAGAGRAAALRKFVGTNFDGQASWFQMYDRGAEIIGTDVLVLTKKNSPQSVVIKLDYAEA